MKNNNNNENIFTQLVSCLKQKSVPETEIIYSMYKESLLSDYEKNPNNNIIELWQLALCARMLGYHEDMSTFLRQVVDYFNKHSAGYLSDVAMVIVAYSLVLLSNHNPVKLKHDFSELKHSEIFSQAKDQVKNLSKDVEEYLSMTGVSLNEIKTLITEMDAKLNFKPILANCPASTFANSNRLTSPETASVLGSMEFHF